ncbi:MAG: hypothetical protein ACUVUC_15930 [Thermoguttaceae bacterium]
MNRAFLWPAIRLGWAAALVWGVVWAAPASNAPKPPAKTDQPADKPAGAPKPARPDPKSDQPAPRYTLRYKFAPGQTLRWNTLHEATVESTVSGTTQLSQTRTGSVKAWRVEAVRPDGTATFETRVESVDMWQKVTGRMELRYNSQTDKKPPAAFEDVPKRIGVPLSLVTIDGTGKVLERKPLLEPSGAGSSALVCLPLPDRPVAPGDSWTAPYDQEVSPRVGVTRNIKARLKLTLEEVKDDVASIRVVTEVMTPITDPTLEAQMIQREFDGRVRFDIRAGRMISQQFEVDKRVVGFAGQPASVLGYRTRFTEEFLGQEASQTVEKRPTPAGTESARRPSPSP